MFDIFFRILLCRTVAGQVP